MTKTSAELTQKAAGFMLAAANARKRELKLNEKNKKTVTKTSVTKTTITKTTTSKNKK
jgi:hypothetical protein